MSVLADSEVMFMQIDIKDEDQKASFGLPKVVSSNTKTRDFPLVHNANHPLPFLRFKKQLPVTA